MTVSLAASHAGPTGVAAAMVALGLLVAVSVADRPWYGRGGSRRKAAMHRGARWGRPRDLASLLARKPEPGRLVLGLIGGRGTLGRRTVAAEPAQSLAVVGTTQSGKTTALAVPAILRWSGPVLAASVKTDLLADTIGWRRGRGTVWCFDPVGVTGVPSARWSPLASSRSWAGARRAAADLTEVAQGPETTADGEFWYATAAKLLAPLLFAAAVDGRSMRDVVRWVDTQEVGEVAGILGYAGVPEALHAACATFGRDDRQRSSVYTTVETILEPFAEPDVPGAPNAPHDVEDDIDVERLLTGDNSLYLCAPAHDQRRLRAVFTGLVKEVFDAAYTRAARSGAPLDPPLLVVLDEAANIAVPRELDGLAATAAGHGVQLVTVWQDLAQVGARFGPRAATVVNNHRAKLFLSGTSDPGTLDQASHLVGDEEVLVPSITSTRDGSSTTASPLRRPLLPPDALRRLAPGTGVLLYGSLPPLRLTLRPWWEDRELARRAGGHTPKPGRRVGRRPLRRRVIHGWRRSIRQPSPSGR